MTFIRIPLTQPRPFFAELPHYLWGQVNYDSEGNCATPTDQQWNFLELENRDTRETLVIREMDETWNIEGEEATITRAKMFLDIRSGGALSKDQTILKDPRHINGMKWADAIAREFRALELKPFDSHDFWGSWKWIGWFGTDFTWLGRWIMHAVVRNDPRAVHFCIYWLKGGTYSPSQSAALRYALNRFTGLSFETDQKWIKWYEGRLFTRGAKHQYPKPDTKEWLADIKTQVADAHGGIC